MYVNSDNIPNLTDNGDNDRAKIKWKSMTDSKYCMLTNKYLHEIHIPTEEVVSKDLP